MIIDAGHRKWAGGTLFLAAACSLLYILYARAAPAGPSGGSGPGLCFGVAATSLIIFAALLGARRKLPAWRLGRAATWLKGHIWLGLLSVLLVLFHGGFSLGGPLTATLLVLLFAVTGSGLFGLALQQFIPRLMTDQAPLETVYEEIPHIIEQLREEADARISGVCGDLGLQAAPEAPRAAPTAAAPAAAAPAAAAPVAAVAPPASPAAPAAASAAPTASPHRAPTPEEAAERRARHRAATVASAPSEAIGSAPLKEFYLARARPYLSPSGRDSELDRKEAAASLFERLRTLLPADPPALQEALGELADICEERRQLRVQSRLHAWLHGWLLVHAPLTVALLVLTLFHAVWALRY